MNNHEALTAILNSLEASEEEPLDEASNSSDQEIPEPQNALDDDSSFDSEMEIEDTSLMPFVTGKDGEKWYFNPVDSVSRTSAENTFKVDAGFTRNALRTASTPSNAFGNFFSQEILQHIVKCTNKFIETEKPTVSPVSIEELKTFFGCLFLVGVFKAKGANHREFWSEKYGIPQIKKSDFLQSF